MNKYFYCKSWFRAKKYATTPFSNDQARKLHQEGKPYCVLVGSVEQPSHFIEVTNNFVSVGFLDEQLREHLSYQFQEEEQGKLFLSMATWREFEGLSDIVTKGYSYLFNTDGSLTIRRQTFFPEHMLETSESTFVAEGNWDDYPEFGKYEPFIKSER